MPIFKMRLRTMMGLVALVAALLWVVACAQVSLGIGSTPLKITFLVVETGASRPIGGATIEFQEEGFPADPVVIKTTDLAGKFVREGSAKVVSRHTCWNATYSTGPPDIAFRTSAPGFVSTAWMPLHSPEYYQALKSDHPVTALDVKIRLVKSPSLPSKSAERVHP